MSKKSLANLKQIRGDVITDEPSKLEFKQDSHKVSLAAKYEDKLSELELDDLQELAGDLGIALTDNRDSLIKAIKREFKKK